MIGTQFKLFDLSAIPSLPGAQDIDNSPVILAACATSKGTEDLIVTSGKDFHTMYGDANFQKYGQISEQTMRAVANGARVAFKRLVATDATLANAVVCAELYQTKAQAKNAEGQLLYVKADGTTTTEQESANTEDGMGSSMVQNEPLYDYTCNVKYVYKTVPDVKSLDDVKEAALTFLDETGKVSTLDDEHTEITTFTYPLFIITDNGRGTSNKRWYITPERKLSKNLDFMFYTLNVVEDGKVTDAVKFSLLPDVLYHNENMTLDIQARTNLEQINATTFDEIVSKFIQKVSDLSVIDIETVSQNDFLFGCQRKGKALAGILVDDVNGLQLNIQTGFNLQSGTNGNFTDAPYAKPETRELVEQEMLKFYDGTTTDKIWDKDNYQIDLCFDADFPIAIKEAIVVLTAWREDFVFFRDYGLDITCFDEVYSMHDELTPSTYVSDFCQTYDVISPYTAKINRVTMTYSISAIMVNHMVYHRNCPFAGKRYNAVISDIVKNSLQYAPRVTPNIDEKDELEDIKVNFASYFDNQFVIESVWTSQTNYTQLSFTNNVLALQQVLKALRKKFPQIRYAFITKKEDLKAYEKEVNDTLSIYSSNFAELSYQYIDDAVYRANKIFRAKLNFRFNDFVQAEMIDVYALPTEDYN